MINIPLDSSYVLITEFPHLMIEGFYDCWIYDYTFSIFNYFSFENIKFSFCCLLVRT